MFYQFKCKCGNVQEYMWTLAQFEKSKSNIRCEKCLKYIPYKITTSQIDPNGKILRKYDESGNPKNW